MKCVKCEAQLPEDANFCTSCEAAQKLVCKSCNIKVPVDAKRCSNCGKREFEEPEVSTTIKTNW